MTDDDERPKHPGSYCSPDGATGKFSTGRDAICSARAPGDRTRWRASGPPPAKPSRRRKTAPAATSVIISPEPSILTVPAPLATVPDTITDQHGRVWTLWRNHDGLYIHDQVFAHYADRIPLLALPSPALADHPSYGGLCEICRSGWPAAPPDTRAPVSFDDRAAAALQGVEALGAAPVRVVRDHAKGTMTLAGVPDSQQRDLLLGVLAYSGGTYDDINSFLRGHGMRGDRAKAEANIGKLRTAMSHSPLQHDVVTYRGLQDGRAVFGDAWNGDLTGHRYREPAFSSTATHRRVVDDFINNRDPAPVEMRLFVPAGTHAMNLSSDGGEHIDEAELLLDLDLPHHIISDAVVNGRRHLDVIIEPAVGGDA